MENNQKKNYIYNLLYQFVAIAYPIILTPYTSRVFKPEGVGDYSYTVAIVTIFILTLNCMGRYGFKEISYYRDDKQEMFNAFWSIFSLKTIVFFFLVAGYLFVSFYSVKYRVLLLAQLVSLVYYWLDIGWFWQGNEKYGFTSITCTLNRVLMLILVFIFIRDVNDLPLYAFLVSFVMMISVVIQWLALRKKILLPNNLNIKNKIIDCLLVSLPFMIIELYSSIDKTMIGLITSNSAENGFYEETLKITKMVMVIVTSMSLIKAPRHTLLFKQNRIKELQKSMEGSFSFLFLMGVPITIGLCVVSNKCIPLFLGEGYEPVILLMYIYSPFILLHGLIDILANQYFIPINKQNFYTLSVVISCIVNILLNLIFIRFWNAKGAVISTIISELVGCFALLYISRKEFNIFKIISKNYKIFISAILMFVCTYSVSFFHLNICYELCGQVFLGIIVYFASLIILKEKGTINFLYSLFKKLYRRRKI